VARAAVNIVAPGPLDATAVLNVDPSDVYAREHVPGAAWLCRSRLELGVGERLRDYHARVVVTCADGLHSTLAGATLARLGYHGVRVVEGGTRGWAAAGLPVERGATTLWDEPDDVVAKPYDRGRPAMEAYLRWEAALDSDGRSLAPLFPSTPRAS
jgi:rhodanese-related sulfurtransferase